MPARNPPETWFWSHDIKPDQIADSIVIRGAHLMRLASYGEGPGRRFANVVYKEPGPPRTWFIDLDAAAVAAKIAETGAHPVGIDAYADGAARRFALVLQSGPGPLSSFHPDLDDAGVQKLLAGGGQRVVDFTTWRSDAGRRYAVILEERSEPSWWLSGLTARELDAKLVALGARLVRLRGYVEGGERRFTAVAEKSPGGRWSWYADLDRDAVGKKLETNHSYPVDLDPSKDARGVRFNVVMYEDRPD